MIVNGHDDNAGHERVDGEGATTSTTTPQIGGRDGSERVLVVQDGEATPSASANHIHNRGIASPSSLTPSSNDDDDIHNAKKHDDQSNGNGNHDLTSTKSAAEANALHSTPSHATATSTLSPEDTRTSLETTVIMTSLCLSVFLAALDITIVTTALPTIARHFHSNAGYTWVGSAYLLANAASVPSWGKFSDIWGRKPMLLCAVGVFFVGSTLAATSVSIGMLIAARAVQGIGGGGVINLVNICISDLFSMRNRGKYFGMVGMTWAAACSLGPILGGVFSEKVSWRWCFYINLPITGAVFILLVLYLKLEHETTPVLSGLRAVDWFGTLAIVGGTLMLLLGLEFGGVTRPWSSATVLCLIIFGVFTFGLFIVNEWRFVRYPMIPLRLFRSRHNLCSFGVCFFHGYVFTAGTYYAPLYFQSVLGATPILSGVYILPFGIALSIVSATTGILIKRTGLYRPWIISGLVLMTLGFGLYIDLPLGHTWSKIVIFQIIAGIGVGPNFQSPLVALQSGTHPSDIATATATFGFVRMISQAISVVIGGVIFNNRMQAQSSTLRSSLGNQLASQLSGGNASANIGIVQSLPSAQRAVARHAFWSALRSMWIMYVCFAAVGLLVSLGITTTVLEKRHRVQKTGLKAEEERYQGHERRRREERESKTKGKTEGAKSEPVSPVEGAGVPDVNMDVEKGVEKKELAEKGEAEKVM